MAFVLLVQLVCHFDSESGLFPSNCRVLDGKEAMLHQVAEDGSSVLLLAFESADHPIEPVYQPSLNLNLPTQSPEATFEQAQKSFLKQLDARRKEDLARGTTLVGPHRDEVRFIADEIDLGTFGSRGQQRTAVLALKLAEVHWLRSKIEDWPILLLDEVMAELDVHRRSFLLGQINGANQCVLTATDPEMFTVEFRAQARLMRVTRGRVET